MKKNYLVLGPFCADTIDAIQYDLILGLISPAAVAGLGYNFCLQLNQVKMNGLHDDVVHDGTAIIVHDHSLTTSHERYIKSVYQDTPSKAREPSASEDRFIARAKISFVISFKETENDPMDLVKASLKIARSLRFSSSKLFPFVDDEKLVRFADTDDVLSKHLCSGEFGFLLTDRSDMLADELQALKEDNDKADVMDAFLNILEFRYEDFYELKDTHFNSSKKLKKKEVHIVKTETIRKFPGWLVPVFVGYQGLEVPRLRSNTRMFGEALHTYAESLYSIGEYKSLYRLARVGSEGFKKKSLWKHHENLETSTYFVKAI
jgi:CRISPR type I-F-associated protein Csy2